MKLYSPETIGLLWGGSELGLSLMKRAKAGATSKDRHSLGLIWLVNLSAITLAIVAANRLPACRLVWPKLLLESGLGLFVGGIALRWYSIFYLGRFFTVNVAIAPDHRVIDTGPYHYIRHPSYAGGLLAVWGFTLTFNNWASLLLIILPVLAVQMWRIHIEEAALLEALGESYRNYRQRTKRLIPFIY